MIHFPWRRCSPCCLCGRCSLSQVSVPVGTGGRGCFFFSHLRGLCSSEQLVGYSLWLQPYKWNSSGRLMSSQVKSVKTNSWQDFQVAVLATFFSQLPPCSLLSPFLSPAFSLMCCVLPAGIWASRFHNALAMQVTEEPSRHEDP